MPEKRVTGSCLCGEVSYAIKGNMGIFQYCNCSRCRKFTGSAFASNLFVAPVDFIWLKGEALVGRYELPEAKHFATSFCKKCGSSLPWLAQSGRTLIVPAGTLDDDPQIKPMQRVYCASRADWYQAPEALPSYDELPIKR
jgi:hypothetical protein